MINWNLVEIPMYETIQLYISKIWIKKNATSNHWLSTGRHKGLLEHEWCWNEFLLNDAYHNYITLIFDNLINSFLSWQFWISWFKKKIEGTWKSHLLNRDWNETNGVDNFCNRKSSFIIIFNLQNWSRRLILLLC